MRFATTFLTTLVFGGKLNFSLFFSLFTNFLLHIRGVRYFDHVDTGYAEQRKTGGKVHGSFN